MNNTALIIEPRYLERLPSIIDNYKSILSKSIDKWDIVFYCGKGLKNMWDNTLIDIDIRELEVTNLTPNGYNDLLKSKELWNSIYGKYVLVFQSDSYLVSDNGYSIDNFVDLGLSYIGGNMDYMWEEFTRDNIPNTTYRNFNGGLSLRYREDMLRILDIFPPMSTLSSSMGFLTDAEDVYFSIGCYRLGLRLGTTEYCSHFAVHGIYKDRYFGIHNPHKHLKSLLTLRHPEILTAYI